MSVSYIENIRNNSGRPYYMWAKDTEHLGVFYDANTGKQMGTNDDGAGLLIPPGANLRASWCGIPWYYQNVQNRWRAISTNPDKSVGCLWLIQSNVDNSDGISFYSSESGVLFYRLKFDHSFSGDRHYSLIFDQFGSIILQCDNSDLADKYIDKISDAFADATAVASDLSQIAANLKPKPK